MMAKGKGAPAGDRYPLKARLRYPNEGQNRTYLGSEPQALRRERLVEKIHRLGPRPLLELLLELEAGADLDDVLVRYGRLDPDVVHAIEADQFAPRLWGLAS